MSTTTSNPLQRTVTLSVPLAALDQQIASRLRNLAKTARMQGFRPGKVPMKMVEQMYGYQVRQEVLSEAVEKNFADSVREMRVAGAPRIEALDPPAGTTPDDVKFTATFEVFPEVKLGDLSKQKVVRHETTVTDADVDRTMETLRKQRATFQPITRAAKDGDMVNIDFAGSIDGTPFEGGSAQNFGVTLGEKRMLPDFEAGIVGMQPGEAKDVTVAFPDDYQAENLRGKKAVFKITLNQVSEPVLPALDSDFARALGVADGNLEQLRKEVRENLEREVKKRVANLTKDQVMDAVLAVTEFAVPQALIDQETTRLQQSALEDLKQRGMTTKDMTLPRDIFAQPAERRARLSLIISEIMRSQDVKADARSVRTLIEEHAASFEQPAELVRWFYTQPERMAEVEALVVENKVVEWIISQAAVETRNTPFTELMAQQGQDPA